MTYLIPRTTADLPLVLTTEYVAAYLRVDGECENELLDDLTQAAMEWAEGVNGANQPLFIRPYTATLSRFCSCYLPGINPSVTGVTYTGTGSDPIALLESNYALADSNRLSFYGTEGITSFRTGEVSYTAGYEQVPADIKHALLLYVGAFYENRANPVQERVTAAERLLMKYRHHYLI